MSCNMHDVELKPTPNQTFEIIDNGNSREFDFSKIEREATSAQRSGDVEMACNIRFQAFQVISELIPDEQEIILEWEHQNSQSALNIVYGTAIDHFLVNDFEMSAAILELLLDIDPEDHLGGIELLAFNYLAMGELESFEDVFVDISDKEPCKHILTAWAEYIENATLTYSSVRHLQSRLKPYFDEFTADDHSADDAYLVDIEGDNPSQAAQARELWFQTENLWRLNPEFISALKSYK